MCGRGSKSVISTQSQHYNVRENFVRVIASYVKSSNQAIWHKFMMLSRPDLYFSEVVGMGGARLHSILLFYYFILYSVQHSVKHSRKLVKSYSVAPLAEIAM